MGGAEWGKTGSPTAQAILKLCQVTHRLSFFSCLCVKGNLRLKGVCFCSEFKVQSIMMGESRQLDVESAHHCTCREWRLLLAAKPPLLSSLPPSTQSMNQVREWQHPQWVDLPTPINEIKIISQRHTQRFIFQAIPDSVKLTININLHTKDGFEPHTAAPVLQAPSLMC